MALVKCPECGREISDKALACPHCAYPMTAAQSASNRAQANTTGETTLQIDHPSMFRNRPFLFSLYALLVIAGPVMALMNLHWAGWLLTVAGAVAFLVWWLICLSMELTLTDERTILRKGLLSKRTNEVRHEDVRNIQVTQSFVQRMLGVGRIAISSAGQDTIEIDMDGVRDPQAIANLIRVRQ